MSNHSNGDGKTQIVQLWDNHGQLEIIVYNPQPDGSYAALGHCVHGSELDSEIGCLYTPSLLSPQEQKFSYVRYNCMMDSKQARIPMTPTELMLDNLGVIQRLQEIGRTYALTNLLPTHL